MPFSLVRQSLYAHAIALPALMAGLSLFWIGMALMLARLG
jgi:hypothetical protein